ncbi:MAG: TRAP transporter large permease subunit [Dehalobacterium sp.]
MMMVVPMFVLMGELAFRSGISTDLFNTAYKWLGKAPGGLANVCGRRLRRFCGCVR